MNHRLTAKSQEQLKLNAWNDYFQLVQEYALSLHSIEDLEILISFSLDAALSLVDASKGSIFLWDDSRKEFLLKAGANLQGLEKGDIRIKWGEGIVGRVAESAEPLLVVDIDQEESILNRANLHRYRSRSFISLPLIFENKLIGVLNVTERENEVEFSSEDLWLLEILSSHISLAYENRRHSQRLKKETESLQRELHQQKINEGENSSFYSVGKFVVHLAHELNNPLDAIRRYVNLALDQVLENTLAREHLLKAKTGIRRAIAVVRELLEFSKHNHPVIPPQVELHDLLAKSLVPFQSDSAFSGIQIHTQFEAMPFWVKDFGLSLVLRNIYLNACQAMDGRGDLTVRTICLANQSIRIFIEDTGPGVPDSIQSKIFAPFFSTKPHGEGVGIGLSLCREIVERSQGKITCKNKLEKGAVFIIELPGEGKK